MKGEYFAAGVGAAMTKCRGADLLIIDDPQVARNRMLYLLQPEWYTSLYRQRLQPGGSMQSSCKHVGQRRILKLRQRLLADQGKASTNPNAKNVDGGRTSCNYPYSRRGTHCAS